jgi:hypothetical protein
MIIREVVMFKKNSSHEQITINKFNTDQIEDMFNKAEETEYYYFYKMIFRKIKEEDFKCLYCEDNGRPNSSINSMLSALILKSKKDWTYRELFSQLTFNLAVRMSIGIFDFSELPFNQATLFNFQNKLKKYYEEKSINLIENLFDNLTKAQLAELKIKTDIARTDSILINSNIRKYGLVQLVLETILRLYRVFTEKDKELFNAEFGIYTQQTSEKYIYDLKGSDLDHELEKLCSAYYKMNKIASDKYNLTEEYKVFKRAFKDFFEVKVGKSPVVKKVKKMGGGCLQSPDDVDATYRKKNGKDSRGYAINVIETANPENDLNLIVDVAVKPNNVDDSTILNERIDKMIEKIPELNELHSDGAYGSVDNDAKLCKLGVVLVQTAVRGHSEGVSFEIEKSNNQITLICPFGQRVVCDKTKAGRHRAIFEKSKCNICPYVNDCQTKKQINQNTFYFDDEYLGIRERHNAILNIPKERRKIRANVESTMNEYACKTNGHKVRVRGYFKVSLFAFTTTIGINFGRIFRIILNNMINSGDKKKIKGLLGKKRRANFIFIQIKWLLYNFLSNLKLKSNYIINQSNLIQFSF